MTIIQLLCSRASRVAIERVAQHWQLEQRNGK